MPDHLETKATHAWRKAETSMLNAYGKKEWKSEIGKYIE